MNMADYVDYTSSASEKSEEDNCHIRRRSNPARLISSPKPPETNTAGNSPRIQITHKTRGKKKKSGNVYLSISKNKGGTNGEHSCLPLVSTFGIQNPKHTLEDAEIFPLFSGKKKLRKKVKSKKISISKSTILAEKALQLRHQILKKKKLLSPTDEMLIRIYGAGDLTSKQRRLSEKSAPCFTRTGKSKAGNGNKRATKSREKKKRKLKPKKKTLPIVSIEEQQARFRVFVSRFAITTINQVVLKLEKVRGINANKKSSRPGKSTPENQGTKVSKQGTSPLSVDGPKHICEQEKDEQKNYIPERRSSFNDRVLAAQRDYFSNGRHGRATMEEVESKQLLQIRNIASKDNEPECKSTVQMLIRHQTITNEASSQCSSTICFIPRMELKRLMMNPESSSEPICISFEGAVMFCDISGFTKLTESLQNDPDIRSGAETLTRIMNSFFEDLINLIERYDGDVVKFCGDAILVVFSKNMNQKESAIQACSCALAIQDKFMAYETEQPGVLFSVHMGIGVGKIHCMYVGGMYSRWEMVFAGEPMLQIKTATSDAKPGETVLSPEARRCISDIAYGTELENQNFLLKGIKLPPRFSPSESLFVPPHTLEQPVMTAVRRYVPGAVLSRLIAGHTRAEINELRQVTIIFFNTPQLDVKDATEVSLLQKVVLAAQHSLYYFEGSVNKFLVDDKGSTLVGAFGLPPLSHEDDAIRGIQSGIMMRQKTKSLGLTCSIGITTGQIFCGILGSQLRSEYAVMGDSVNLAARLMQHGSPDDILCDDTTFWLSSRWLSARKISCIALDPIKVKGKTELIQVYRPEESEQQGAVSGLYSDYASKGEQIVSRAEEKRLINQSLVELCVKSVHKTKCLWIEGDAGIGKSEVLKNLFHQSKVNECQLYFGAADSVEQTVAYYAYRDIFTQLFLQTGTRGRYSKSNASNMNSLLKRSDSSKRSIFTSLFECVPLILAEIDTTFVPLMSLLNVVFPVEFQKNDVVKGLSNDDVAVNTQEMLVRTIEYFCQNQRLVIALEDCQWLDSKSWALTLDILYRVPHVLIVATSRPLDVLIPNDGRSGDNEQARKNKRRRRQSTLARVTKGIPAEYTKIRLMQSTKGVFLEELDAESLALIVANRIGVEVSDMPEIVIKVLDQKAKGNPFVALELISHMKDTGLLKISDGICRVSSRVLTVDDIEFPENVRGLITGRLDRLPANEQLVMRIASAIGRVFDIETLQSVANYLKANSSSESEKKIDIDEALESLQKSNFICFHDFHTSKGCEEYRFDMDIVKDVAYCLMSYEFRRIVHLAIAKIIEESQGENLGQVDSLLAYHYIKAEEVKPALEYLTRAGRKSLQVHGYSECVKIYSEAIKLYRNNVTKMDFAPYKPVIVEWYSNIGEAYTNLGDTKLAKVYIKDALGLLGSPYPMTVENMRRKLLEEVITHRVLQSRKANDCSEIEAGPPSDNSSEKEDKYLMVSSIYTLMSRLAYFEGDEEGQSYTILKSLNLASKTTTSSPQLAKCLAATCLVATTYGLFEKAQSYANQALLITEAVNSPSASLYVYIITSLFYIQIGKLKLADKGLTQAMVLASKQGNLRRCEESFNLRGTIAYIKGNFQQGAVLFNRGSASAHKRGDNQMFIRLVFGEIACKLNLDQSVNELMGSLPSKDEKNATQNDLVQILHAVTIMRSEVAKEQKIRAFRKAVKGIEKGNAQVQSYIGYTLLLDCITHEDLSDSNDIIQQLFTSFYSFCSKFQVGRPRYYSYKGIKFQMEGRTSAAKKCWDHSSLLNCEFHENAILLSSSMLQKDQIVHSVT